MNKSITVIGHGLMGRGIIFSFASNGIGVIAIKRRENDNRLLDYFKAEFSKGNISKDEYTNILNNVEITTDLTKAAKSNLVIEAINEDVEKKTELFLKLDEICSPDTILASNTSSIHIGKIANITRRREKVVGLHYMSPVPKMKLVEVVKGIETSEETIQYVCSINKEINKIPIVVKDFPGFVASRLVAAVVNEAALICMEGVAEANDIDTIAKLGMNWPVGPLRLADEIGLDIVVDVMDNMYRNFKTSRYSLCPQLRMMCDTGLLGRKSGKGYYKYNND